MMLSVVIAVSWHFIRGTAGVEFFANASTLDVAFGRKGASLEWEGDYRGYSITPFRTFFYRDGDTWAQSQGTFCGLSLHSGYTRNDWGHVHANAYLLISPPWILAALLAVAVTAHRINRKASRVPGHCQRCGYDLRATPERCPECGRETRA